MLFSVYESTVSANNSLNYKFQNKLWDFITCEETAQLVNCHVLKVMVDKEGNDAEEDLLQAKLRTLMPDKLTCFYHRRSVHNKVSKTQGCAHCYDLRKNPEDIFGMYPKMFIEILSITECSADSLENLKNKHVHKLKYKTLTSTCVVPLEEPSQSSKENGINYLTSSHEGIRSFYLKRIKEE